MFEHPEIKKLKKKLYMTDKELADFYKRAGGVSQESIVVAADLNAIQYKEMAWIMGFENLRDAPKQVLDLEKLEVLYKTKHTDREMAAELSVDVSVIRTWRKKNGLECNFKRRKKSE